MKATPILSATIALLFAPVLSAQIVHLDFNDSSGRPTLQNAGSARGLAAFNGRSEGRRSDDLPGFSDEHAPSNTGGSSVVFEPTKPYDARHVKMEHLDQLNDLKSVTVTGWLRFIPTSNEYAAGIISWAGEDTGLYIYRSASGQLMLQAGMSKTLSLSLDNPDRQVPENEWVFIAVCIDATEERHQIRFYTGREGVLYERNILIEEFVGSAGSLGSNDSPLIIGNTQDLETPNGARPWSGNIDNLRIYGSQHDSSGALPKGEIEAIMHHNDSPLVPASR